MIRILTASGLVLALAGGAAAQEPPNETPARPAPAAGPVTPAERLETLERAISAGTERRTAVEAERARAQAKLAGLQEKLVAAAAAVQAREDDIVALEAALEQLAAREIALVAELRAQRTELAALFTALIRLERDRPPAIALRPEDSLAAARGAMIVGTLTPDLESAARRTAQTLDALRATKREEEDRRDAADRARAALAAEEAGIEALLVQKRALDAALEAESERLQAAIAAVAREAKDLRTLIARVSKAASRADGPSLTQVTARGQVSDDARVERARGKFIRPVTGRATARFGDNEGGGRLNGVRLDAASGATVVAPFDGEVLFAESYKNYGHLLILRLSDAYTLVLAGLDRSDVRPGDWVLAGEPVGRMGRGSNGRSELYMELQKSGASLDPAPWLKPVGKVGG